MKIPSWDNEPSGTTGFTLTAKHVPGVGLVIAPIFFFFLEHCALGIKISLAACLCVFPSSLLMRTLTHKHSDDHDEWKLKHVPDDSRLFAVSLNV